MAKKKLIKQENLFAFDRAIDAVGQKYVGASLEHFRKAVWAVFVQLVLTTPQFTGRAAANWNIGIDHPDFSVDYNAGERIEVVPAKNGGSKFEFVTPRHQGDMKWAAESFERNEYKLMKIKSNTKVFITNAVQGDVDEANGRSTTYYLADLQDPTYWAQRLRFENMPYETVSEVLLSESWRQNLHLKGNSNNQRFFL